MNLEIRRAAFESVCAYWRTGLPWRVPVGTSVLNEVAVVAVYNS